MSNRASSDQLVASVVDCLYRLSLDECDFTRIIVDIVSDISELIENKTDSDDVALQLNQLTLEELEKQSILATMKCLNIVKIMLQKAKRFIIFAIAILKKLSEFLTFILKRFLTTSFLPSAYTFHKSQQCRDLPY